MSNVTKTQKKVLIDLARKYDPDVLRIVERGAEDSVDIRSQEEAEDVELFADKVCSLVLVDHPDHSGMDEDIINDAALAANIAARLVHEYRSGAKRRV
jgi:hypothetical protein